MLTNPNKYTGQIDWGDWRNMPDYREGWRNPHSSPVSQIMRVLNFDTFAPGFLGELARGRQDIDEQRHEVANQVLSPVVGFLQDGQDKVLPYHKEFHHAVGLDGIDQFIREKPADAAAIAAASYFAAAAAAPAASGTSGAAAESGAGASTGISSATLNTAGNAMSSGLSSASTLSTAPAAGSAGSAMSAAITPAFESAAGSALAPTAFTYGGIGATGYAAGTSALTPTLSAADAGLFGTLKNAYKKFDTIDSYRSNLQRFANNNGPTDRERSNAQAAALAERILNAGQTAPADFRKKVATQIMMNRWGAR